MGGISKFISVLLIIIFITTGCGTETVDNPVPSEENKEASDNAEENPEDSPEEPDVTEPLILNIYYSNEMADGLEKTEIEADTLTPELLLSKLAEYNIVTKTTTVNSVETVQEGEETVLLLDLSKEFEEHVSTMGTSGEYVIVAALTNTFLDAYEAQRLRLRVDDKYLDSGHARYDWDLTKYQMTSYTVETKTYEKDKIRLDYPQLYNLKESMADEWNEILEAYAMKEVEQLDESSEYVLTYEVATATEELLSIVYRADGFEQGAAHPYRTIRTFNIDLTTGKEWRLQDFVSPKRVVECLEDGEFELINTEMDKKEFMDYLSSNMQMITVESLEAYDLDSTNIRDYIPGYSYRLDEQVVVCMEVPYALGSYMEIVIAR